MRTIQILCMVSLVVSVLAGQAGADMYSGSLSSTTGGLIGYGNWATGTSSISWTVEQLADNWWRYSYTLTTPGSPAISHFILEVSDSFGANDYRSLTWNGTAWSADGIILDDPDPSNPSNPGMPSNSDWNFGMKIDATVGTTGTLAFESSRVPVWGDFYGKGGRDSSLYNAGLGIADPTAAAANGALDNHLLVPDSTTYVPLPPALLLCLLGLGGAGWKLRRCA